MTASASSPHSTFTLLPNGAGNQYCHPLALRNGIYALCCLLPLPSLKPNGAGSLPAPFSFWAEGGQPTSLPESRTRAAVASVTIQLAGGQMGGQ